MNTQTLGSVTVIGVVIAAEASARWLSACPGSPMAWYLNIELFRAFELARIDASPLRHLFGPGSLAGAAALLLATLGARWLRFELGVAAIANVCFVGAAALAYPWLKQAGAMEAASLAPIVTAHGHDGAVMALMLASSFVAAAASHAAFLARIASDRRAAADAAAR